MQNERSGWAAAVGTKYLLNNGQPVMITRYRADLEASGYVGQILEGRFIETPDQLIQWSADGKTVSHLRPDYDLKTHLRGAKK